MPDVPAKRAGILRNRKDSRDHDPDWHSMASIQMTTESTVNSRAVNLLRNGTAMVVYCRRTDPGSDELLVSGLSSQIETLLEKHRWDPKLNT